MVVMLPRTLPMDLPLPRRPVFGDRHWIITATVESALPPDRFILCAARVKVNRTPLYEIVGGPDPVDPNELWAEKEPPDDVVLDPEGPIEPDWTFAGQLAEKATVIDYDPVKYAPYQWLVEMGHPDGYPDYYLVEMG